MLWTPFLLFSSSAKAVTYSGSVGGKSFPSVSDPYPLKIWDLGSLRAEGVNHALRFISNYRPPPGKKFYGLRVSPSVSDIVWSKDRSVIVNRDNLSSKQLTNFLLAGCPGANCPLWTDHSRQVNENNAPYHKHRAWSHSGEDRYLGPKATLAFNIRIWRENPRSNGFDLILKRSVGSEGLTDHDRCRRPTLIRSLQNWWGGCRLDDGIGPIYTANGKSMDAGPLGPSHGPLAEKCHYPGTIFNPRQNQRNRRDIRLSEQRQGGGVVNTLYPPLKSPYATSSVIPRSRQYADFAETSNGAIKTEGDCYWEGESLANPFSWDSDAKDTLLHFIRKSTQSKLSSGSIGPSKQFGSTKGKAAWKRNRSGIVGRGLKEAVWLRWKIPSQNGRASLDYRIEGVPGLAYVVHIVRISPKEQMQGMKPKGMKPKGSQSSYHRAEQYFRAYMPNVFKGADEVEVVETARPEVSTTLELEKDSAVINEEVSSKMTTQFSDTAQGSDSVAFPRLSNFWHYTPQSQYSIAANFNAPNLYSHVLYNDLCTGPLVPGCFGKNLMAIGYLGSLGIRGNEAKQGIGSTEFLAKLSQVPTIGAIIFDDQEYTTELDLTWREPTLANPCPGGVDDPDNPEESGFNKKGSWSPKTRNTDCQLLENGEKFANSWDDMLDAESQLDLVWLGAENQPTVAVDSDNTEYKEVELRCPGDEIELPAGATCRNGKMSEKIVPQGYFVVKDSSSGVRVELATDSPKTLNEKKITLTPKESDEPVASVSAINPLSEKLELNLCNPGVYDSEITRPQINRGDPNCQGPAANWDFAPGATEQEKFDRCIIREAPTRKDYIDWGFVLPNSEDADLQSPHHKKLPDIPGLPENYFADLNREFPTRVAYGLVRKGKKVLTRDRMLLNYGEDIPAKVGGSNLPGINDSAKDVELVGQILACAFRKRVEFKNIYRQYQVENRSIRVSVVNREAGSGPPRGSAPGGSWSRKTGVRCVGSSWPLRVVPEKGTTCWYSVVYPQAPSNGGGVWSSWQRFSDTRCSPGGSSNYKEPRKLRETNTTCYLRWRWSEEAPTGGEWQKNNSSPKLNHKCQRERDTGPNAGNDSLEFIPTTGNTCWFKWSREWLYRGFPNQTMKPYNRQDFKSNWITRLENKQKGFVLKGSWSWSPIYGGDSKKATTYLQPGYSRIAPSIGYRSGSGVWDGAVCREGDWETITRGDLRGEKECISSTPNATTDISEGLIAQSPLISQPWNLRATFRAYNNIPWNYTDETNNTADNAEQYIKVLAPRFAG